MFLQNPLTYSDIFVWLIIFFSYFILLGNKQLMVWYGFLKLKVPHILRMLKKLAQPV